MPRDLNSFARLNRKVLAAIIRTLKTGSSRIEGTGCELCAPEMETWWIENGFTLAQRDEWCSIHCSPEASQ